MNSSWDASVDCALLVVSCDAYSDLWPPFFNLLREHWSDCPFSVYLGAGERELHRPGIVFLGSNGGRDWSRCVLDYLRVLPHSYVLMMLDDFFLRGRVPTSDVLYCLEFARNHKAIQLRLLPRPKPTDRLFAEILVGECAAGLQYRLSTQAAIWNRQKLMELLQPGESIWEFEHNGNQRAVAIGGFYATWRSVLPYEGLFAHHVIEKGRWLPLERWIFGRRKVGCDFTQRSTMGWGEAVFGYSVGVLDRLLQVFSWRRRALIKCQLKRIFSPILRGRFARMSGVPPVTETKQSGPPTAF